MTVDFTQHQRELLARTAVWADKQYTDDDDDIRLEVTLTPEDGGHETVVTAKVWLLDDEDVRGVVAIGDDHFEHMAFEYGTEAFSETVADLFEANYENYQPADMEFAKKPEP